MIHYSAISKTITAHYQSAVCYDIICTGMNCTMIRYNSLSECSVYCRNTSHLIPFQHIFAEDATPGSLEDNDGYHTNDDMSELEDDELEDSLRKQKDDKVEPAKDIDPETKTIFHTLMRDVS